MRGCCKRNSEYKRGLGDWSLLFYSSDANFFPQGQAAQPLAQTSKGHRLQTCLCHAIRCVIEILGFVPRSCLINTYLSPVTQTNTQVLSPLHHQNAWASWALFLRNLTNTLAHCSFTCSSLMQMIRAVKFWAHLIVGKWRKEIVLESPRLRQGTSAKKAWSGVATLHGMPAGHTR